LPRAIKGVDGRHKPTAMTRGHDCGDEENTDIAASGDYTIRARHVRAFAVTQG
jgi:hypothetical protein